MVVVMLAKEERRGLMEWLLGLDSNQQPSG